MDGEPHAKVRRVRDCLQEMINACGKRCRRVHPRRKK